MNFIYISPQFPPNFKRFCGALKKEGFTVLGVGDTPYYAIDEELKGILAEYYYLPSLEDYDGVYRAVAFLSFKHGKPAYIESNNEYWLSLDAKLREDFNVSGAKPSDVANYRDKIKMKAFYERAGVRQAKYAVVRNGNLSQPLSYPYIVKPVVGVGAARTYKINSPGEFEGIASEVEGFLAEEYIDGEIYTYDAVVDNDSVPVFESTMNCGNSLLDVKNGKDIFYYIEKNMPDSLKKEGRALIKAYGIKKRYIHFEFFKCGEEYVGLEVNMRPAGGMSADMIKFAHGYDAFEIYAKVMADKNVNINADLSMYCAYAGRRNNKNYHYNDTEIKNQFNIVKLGNIPDGLADELGNRYFIYCSDSFEEIMKFKEMTMETTNE